MAITPADIEQLTFSPSKHGYDTQEVDAFLERCAVEVDAMLQKIADLKSRLTSTEAQLAAAEAHVSELEMTGISAPAAPVAPAADLSASERQISQVLIIAQQSADKIVADAREAAENIRNEADQKAREVIRQALAEKQHEVEEIDRLKASREDFRTEYKRLLQHFMDDAEAAFPHEVLSAPATSGAYVAQTAQPVAAEPVAPAPAGDFDDLD